MESNSLCVSAELAVHMCAILNELVAGSIIVIHCKVCTLLGVLMVYGPIKSTFTRCHGLDSAYFGVDVCISYIVSYSFDICDRFLCSALSDPASWASRIYL